jgi:predicted  nucleic acid-binding Zn-ribbon protein
VQATVSHYEARLQKAEVQRAEALTEATSVLEDEISRLIDERDDLMQRIRFLERQLAKAQDGMANEVPLEHQATQTDEGEWAATSTKAVGATSTNPPLTPLLCHHHLDSRAVL